MRNLFLAPLALGLSIAAPADAAYLLTVQQVGNDVVMNGSGTINLNGLTSGILGGSDSMVSSSNFLIIGTNDGFPPFRVWSGITGPEAVRSPSPFQKFATSGTGARFGIQADRGRLLLPRGFGGDSDPFGPSSATYANDTLASLGFSKGTLVYTWGAGADADRLTIQIGPVAAAVPEPESWALMLLGFGTVGAFARRRATATPRTAC